MMKTKNKEMRCPYCKKPTTWENNPTRPFCSEHCKMVDLGQWISGGYPVRFQEELDESSYPNES
ncbi:DNA gyrase inhibitor YacG [Deltaproteobacteria bacterium TL4]